MIFLFNYIISNEWIIYIAAFLLFILLNMFFYRQFFKKFYDFIFSGIFLFFFFIFVFPLVYLAIKLDDKGPVFYCGKRLGKNLEPFKMFKFRTMKVNSPDLRLEDGSTYNAEDDPRVTKVGKILRKTSIDELPQLINIFCGKMSFIGPRPDTLDWAEKYKENEKDFLKLLPGVTGYNQAYFRNSSSSSEKISNDNYYAKKYSFLFDIRILIKTIITVLMRKSIYKNKEEIKENKDIIKEFGSRFCDYTKGENNYFIKLFQNYKNYILFRSARDGLKFIASQSLIKTVLIPEYCCESMIKPFIDNDFSTIFYQINSNLELDLDHFKVKTENIDDFYVVITNYFGFTDIEKTIKQIRSLNKKITIIYDFTQALFDSKIYDVDFLVGSLRKWTGVSDGGIFATNQEFGDVKNIYKDNIFQEMIEKGLELKRLYLSNGKPELKSQYLAIFSEAENYLANDSKCCISVLSEELLHNIDIDELIDRRRKNYCCLKLLLQNCDKLELLKPDLDAICPFGLIVLVNNRELVQKTLAEKGLCTQVLWSKPDEIKYVGEFSTSLYTKMLFIPIDQRYDENDMKTISDFIIESVEKEI